MGTVLSRIILPGPDRMDRSALYYHADDAVICGQGGMNIPAGGETVFDSYFNGFFYPKYLRYTHVTSVSLQVEVEGEVLAGVHVCTQDGERILFERRVSGEAHLPAVELASLPAEGMLYLSVQAVNGPVRFLRGQWETDMEPVNDVKVAVVICTYRREEYVARNLQQLRETVWGDPACLIREQLDVFVVDNGKTLALNDEAHIKIFPNKNCGGSGGFTRGLIEAYNRRPAYTHVLFMDDDISFETETLVKTVQLLRYAREMERPLCVGGQMLLENEPTVQYEAGALFEKGRAVSLRHEADITGRGALLGNGKEYPFHYNGWWYYCQPLELVDAAGLPLPFFIKADDAEYCLRTEPRIVLMNGVGVWHRRFDEKYRVHLEYYIKRNELVTSALHGSGAGIGPGLMKLIRAAGKAALLGDPQAIGFLLRAYRDFLRGPEFFLEADGEALNGELLAEMRKPGKRRLVSILTDPFRLLPVMWVFVRNYKRVRAQYIDRLGELTNMDFWKRYLGI